MGFLPSEMSYSVVASGLVRHLASSSLCLVYTLTNPVMPCTTASFGMSPQCGLHHRQLLTCQASKTYKQLMGNSLERISLIHLLIVHSTL